MMFRFKDPVLDNLASKQMGYENWKNFVDELKSRDLPACYKPITFLDLSDFKSGIFVAILGSLVSSDKGVGETVSFVLDFISRALEQDSATIYDFVEQFPILMLS